MKFDQNNPNHAYAYAMMFGAIDRRTVDRDPDPAVQSARVAVQASYKAATESAWEVIEIQYAEATRKVR